MDWLSIGSAVGCHVFPAALLGHPRSVSRMRCQSPDFNDIQQIPFTGFPRGNSFWNNRHWHPIRRRLNIALRNRPGSIGRRPRRDLAGSTFRMIADCRSVRLVSSFPFPTAEAPSLEFQMITRAPLRRISPIEFQNTFSAWGKADAKAKRTRLISSVSKGNMHPLGLISRPRVATTSCLR